MKLARIAEISKQKLKEIFTSIYHLINKDLLIQCHKWLKENKQLKPKELMPKINAKLRGHYQYFGITDNYATINRFLYEIDKLIFKHLNRRSQRKSYSYETYRKMKENI